MDFPASTGQIAVLLGVPEPRLNDLIRRHKIDPPPAIAAGRRRWERDHALQAAEHLGVLTNALRGLLASESPPSAGNHPDCRDGVGRT